MATASSRSKSKGLNRPALFAALAVTAGVVAGERLGWLDRWENKLLDLRFEYARSSPVPLDERIALVAIEDSSLEQLGRWPWPRSIQAVGVEEIHRAGAKVVAFDILFDAASFDPKEDEALAHAVAACEGVVAANSDPKEFVGAAYQSVSDQEAKRRLLGALSTSISLSNEEIVRQAGVGREWIERVEEESVRYRTLAAWMRLQALRADGRAPSDLKELAAAVGLASQDVSSRELRMLERLWAREEAWVTLSRFMPPASGPPSPHETPPTLEIAKSAGGVGLVLGTPDADGGLRRVHPFMPTPGGDCVQLGIAAAAKLLGLDPRSPHPLAESFVVGDRRLSLHEGRIVIDWPTATFAGLQQVRGGGPGRTIIPFGTLVSLSNEREILARLEEGWTEITGKLAKKFEMEDRLAEIRLLPTPAATRAEIVDSMDFMIPGARERGAAALPPIDAEPRPDETKEAWEARVAKEKESRPADVKDADGFKQWEDFSREVPAARDTIARSEATVRTALEGKLVFVGFVATAIAADMINTPYGPRTPGVFVHAAVANMALGGAPDLKFFPGWVGSVLTLLLGALCAAFAARFAAAPASAIVLALLLGYAAVVVVSFDRATIVVPAAAPLLSGFGSWIACVTIVAIVSQRDRAKIIRQFRARVSSELVEKLTGNPDALSMGGSEREITVLFGDLAGFTTIAEKLGGPEVVITLNRYMGALTRSLTARRAYVNKFLGDGLLAFWSAFGDEPEQRRLAIDAAVECQKAVDTLGREPEFRDRPPIRLRLGIATGRAVVGDCGAPPELNDYTAIGDVVNLSSRLESANKQFGTSVLIDAATAAGASTTEAETLVRLGRVIVVGQSVPVEVFTMVDGSISADARRAVEKAVAAFESGDRSAARDAWHHAGERGVEKLAKAFLSAVDDPEDPFDGILRMRAK